jgi:hypothetical protein
MANFRNKIFDIHSAQDFNELALEIFSYQYSNNQVYHQYCTLLGRAPVQVNCIEDIPFLPIEFYKTHRIASTNGIEKLHFHSSGTTGSIASTHLVFDPSLYEESILKSFHLFFGDPRQYCIVALIPTYTDRPESSLAYMAQLLIQQSENPLSGFYLGREIEIAPLAKKMTVGRTLFWGLSFALADFAEQFPNCIHPDILIETGGMKGQRKEITREELHSLLKDGMGVTQVHSEYSMCELFSQAWSEKDGLFSCPPWMKILIRDPRDPLQLIGPKQSGGINIIDLANIDTCSFIATQDLGQMNSDGCFTVSGRFDHSALRGCSLMLE